MKRSLKHNQRIATYRWTDYSGYVHGEQYIHPEIQVEFAHVRDPLEAYKEQGYKDLLDRAKRLRDATGQTRYLDTDTLNSGFSIRWQSNRESADQCSGYFYHRFYAAKITNCAFSVEVVSLASKLAKSMTGNEWRVSPLDVVQGLTKLSTIPISWHREADCFMPSEHLDDDWFGLPDHIRQQSAQVA